MEDIAQNPINEAAEMFKSLAEKHQVPEEIAEQMIILMDKYPDLTIWGSKTELISNLEKILESAFNNKIVKTE